MEFRRLVFGLQGVTLTDLQEAEKTMKTENRGKEKKDEEEKEAKQKKGDEAVRSLKLSGGCLFVFVRSSIDFVN